MQQKSKTSHSHPIQINGVNIPSCRGQIGMTLCPGKKQPDAMSGHWDRDLDTDIRAIVAWGGKVLVSLMEESEFSDLGVVDLPRCAAKYGLEWFHVPIADFSIPSRFVESQWMLVVRQLKARLSEGENIVFHCKGRLGRTGTMAACLLREFGVRGK